MNDRKNYLKNTTTLMLVAFLVIAASISFVAYADDHQDTVTYDIDDMDDFEVEYPHVMEVIGDSIESGDEFVLNYNNDRTPYTFTADEDGVITIDTMELDTHPTGPYTLEPVDGNVESSGDYYDTEDQLIIDSAGATVDYIVEVRENDVNGDVVGSEEFDAGTMISDYGIDVTGVTDGDDLYVSISEQDEDELDSEMVTISTGAGAPTNDASGTFEDLMAPFTVTGDGTIGDERYHQDFDAGSGSVTLTTVYVGQELVLGSDDLDDADSYELYHHDGDDKILVQDLSVHESDSFNTHELRIDTTLADYEGSSEGSFSVEKNNEEQVSWTAVEQDFDAYLNESTVNLYTENTEVDLNLTSSNRGSGYDVLIDSEQVNATELYELINEDELTGTSSVYVEDAEDEDNEQVRVTNVDTSETDEFTIQLDFDGTDENNYEFDVEVADSDAESTTEDVEVAFFDEGTATFNQGTYVQNQGDTIEFIVNMEDTSEATLKFTEDDYDLEFDVNADTQGGEVIIQMDTYRAGDHNDYTVTGENGVFEVIEGGEIDAGANELPAVNGPFATGLYSMELDVADRNTDLSTLFITDRESHNIETWVMPQGTDSTISNLEDVGTRQEHVAMDDMFVVEVEASGLYSSTLLTNETEVSDFVDMDEFEIDITEKDTARHADNTTINVGDAENIEIAPDDDKFYVFFDTSNDDIFATESGEYEVNEEVEYDIEFNLLNDYKYVHDEEETDANLHETVELVERDIVTNLPSVTVDEETLETKHGLAAVENSTVSGVTHIAPNTGGIDIVVRTEDSQEHETESDFFSERVEVSEDGTISAEFDLSHLELDRPMQIQYRPIDEDYREAVMMEADEPPEIVEFSSDDTPVTEGNEVTFNLDVESTSDALNYNWDFDDGTTSQQTSPAHVYEEAGTYEVEVTVTDNADQSATATTEIVVEEAPNEPPTIEQIVAPTEVDVGEEFTVTAIAFDENQSELEYTWDFDDGAVSSGVSTTHTYDNEGTYDVELTVIDSEGDSSTESITMQVIGADDDEDEDAGPYELTMTAVDSESGDSIPSVSVDILQDGEIVDDVSTDGNGIAAVELENGEYDIEAAVDGYEDLSTGTFIDGEDNQMDLVMTLEDDGDDEDPSQPGFTAMIAAFALIAGSLIAYRRKD